MLFRRTYLDWKRERRSAQVVAVRESNRAGSIGMRTPITVEANIGTSSSRDRPFPNHWLAYIYMVRRRRHSSYNNLKTMRLSSSTTSCWRLFVLLAVVTTGSTTTIGVQGQPIYGGCPPPTPCAAPPEGCNYIPPEPDAQGCIVGCGKLFCEPKDECPVFSCAAPPDIEEDGKICTYGLPDFDWTTGCPTSCPPLERCCPLPMPCARPPDGCDYLPAPRDTNGCIIGCGTLSCNCQDLVCMAPGPGCTYGPRVFNDFGCPISCGELTCAPPALPVCPVCTDSDPCARVRCGFNTRCVARKPRRQYDRRGCPNCATSARCVRRRPYYLRLR
jgi:hypothetical protein